MKHTPILVLLGLVACGGPGKGNGKSPSTTDTQTTSIPTGTPSGTTTVTVPLTEHSNLLILSVDTLRKDHLSRYDPENRDLMPFVDSLMDQGVVADNHHTGSNWTFHAFSTALSGKYPLDEDVLPRVIPGDHNGWPAGSRFLADELSDAGLHTVMASANGWLRPQYGLSNGYDSYLGDAFDPADTTFTLGTDALESAIAGGADRWHLHLHFLEPHAPYVPPVQYRVGEDQLAPLPYDIDSQPAHYDTVGQWPSMSPDEQALLEAHLRVRYDGELRWLDDRLAAFWADLDARGWLDDTLVVFFTDHGEQFWEHGNQSHAFHLYPEETEGVFFLWSKEMAAQTVTVRTSGVDIAPTAFRHLGLDAPADWTGLPLSEIPVNRPVYTDTNARLGVGHAVNRGSKELIYLWDGQAAYYDVVADPTRSNNLYDPSDSELHELWDLLRPRVDQARAEAPYQTPIAPPGLTL